MQRSVFSALVVSLAAASAAEAGVLTYSSRLLVAGISDGTTSHEATDSGLASWFGSKYGTNTGLIQFAGIGSSLEADQFTVSANVALSSTSPSYVGHSAYSTFALNFSLSEESFVTFFLDVGTSNPSGAAFALNFTGPNGSSFSVLEETESTFVRRLSAGDYSLVGSMSLLVPSEGFLLNSGLMSVAANAVAVPAPAVIAGFGLFLGLSGSRRRR